ncbi:MAG: peptidoglycan-binding protein [Pseudomonadota bacterium]
MMGFSTRDIQARCAALGFNPGPIDGIKGRRTSSALQEAMASNGVSSISGLFGRDGLHRIHGHWTGGAYGAIDLELRAYNGVIDHDATRHAGRWGFQDQAMYRAGARGASHTLNANTGSIGLAVDAMAGAQERPFRAGSAPVTWAQVDELAKWIAELSVRFWIPITRYSVLTHAEVQPTLGIRQKWKWDITWLPDMDRPGDPVEVGDRIRALAVDHLDRADIKAAA